MKTSILEENKLAELPDEYNYQNKLEELLKNDLKMKVYLEDIEIYFD